jgi:hypothetical protein
VCPYLLSYAGTGLAIGRTHSQEILSHAYKDSGTQRNERSRDPTARPAAVVEFVIILDVSFTAEHFVECVHACAYKNLLFYSMGQESLRYPTSPRKKSIALNTHINYSCLLCIDHTQNNGSSGHIYNIRLRG